MPYVNHVSIPVDDVADAKRFYEDVLGGVEVPSPNFGTPVAWLTWGGVQLHLVQVDRPASHAYHFAIAFESLATFEALCHRAEREGLANRETFGSHIFEAVGRSVQLYLNDPAGNLVECDYPSIDDLDPAISRHSKQWVDDAEQSDWNRRATVFSHTVEGGPR
jgi:catechol 2,3-dioxygenase-like lactoylglutathione lyase family enzyme